jgi:hypothetical protein
VEAPALVAGFDEAHPGKPFGFVGCSVPPEAPWRNDCLKLAKVEFADRAQRFGGRGILKIVRQAFQPGGILSLEVRQFGDGVVPAAGAAEPAPAEAGGDRLGGGCGSPVRPRLARHGIATGVQHPSWLFHQ